MSFLSSILISIEVYVKIVVSFNFPVKVETTFESVSFCDNSRFDSLSYCYSSLAFLPISNIIQRIA